MGRSRPGLSRGVDFAGRRCGEGVLVYTPPERRRRGYAGACVAALSAAALDVADECILYAQLANPTSNGLYRRLGYEAVAEGLIYRFGG